MNGRISKKRTTRGLPIPAPYLAVDAISNSNISLDGWGGFQVFKSKIPKQLLIGFLILAAASALATQVKLVNFNSGAVQTGSGNEVAQVTVGVPIGGVTGAAPGQSGARLGFWHGRAQYRSVSPVPDEVPTLGNRLFGNYPNPFNPSTEISYALAREAQVRIDLYDLRGRKVDTLFEGIMPAGTHSFTYQPLNLSSGAYVILMQSGSFRATQRIMLLK